MDIVAINGSPHGPKGTTGSLLSEAAKAAEAAGATVATLVVSDYQVNPCRACDVCHRTGSCPIDDDFHRFKDALLAADGIILASPNYLSSVSAQLKAVMDRCCGLLHCQVLRDKHAAAIVTSGGGGEEQVQEYVLGFLRNMGCWTVGAAGAPAGMLADPATRPAALQAAAKLGADLVEAISAGATYPEQQAQRSAFAQRMRQLVIARGDEWTYEADYWRSRNGS
ncbi:MAG TPA: flavodoxin family protein [Phycisphaerae bacterium]|nr:flavodoxin family protein [Phycisphaerae bacterium]